MRHGTHGSTQSASSRRATSQHLEPNAETQGSLSICIFVLRASYRRQLRRMESGTGLENVLVVPYHHLEPLEGFYKSFNGE
jgi:hypothetical protein